MDVLLAGLLRYSRAAQAEISLEPVDVDSLLADLLQELDDDLRSTGAALRVQGPLGRLLADKLLLRQALSNLLSNALKYVAPDERPDITLRTENAGAWARLVVEDRGIGIARGEEERIFRIFERAERSSRYEGSGVGLAIVGKAARRMGGRAGVDSEPSRGSRFWIELPRA
jgi:signal transduction histidine kinase